MQFILTWVNVINLYSGQLKSLNIKKLFTDYCWWIFMANTGCFYSGIIALCQTSATSQKYYLGANLIFNWHIDNWVYIATNLSSTCKFIISWSDSYTNSVPLCFHPCVCVCVCVGMCVRDDVMFIYTAEAAGEMLEQQQYYQDITRMDNWIVKKIHDIIIGSVAQTY